VTRRQPTTSIRRTATYDDDQVDPQEYAKLLDLYDNSFRHIAEGEVVKGTVLKVTETEVVVDVGFKSEGIIALDEFLDENRQVIVQPGTSWTSCSSAPKIAKATSSSPAKKRRR
jgi:small subunit ribosomal protein S1